MKALIFLVLVTTSSEACLYAPRDFVFKCPDPNGNGLQEVFEKFRSLGTAFYPKLGTSSGPILQVNNWLLETLENKLETIRQETGFKNFTSFLCENMYVDGDVYLNITYGGAILLEYKSKTPRTQTMKKYSDEYANYIKLVRQSEIGVGIDILLEKAVASDTYVQRAMDYFTSPKFEAVKEEALSIPQLRRFRDYLRNYNINESDVLYLYTRLSLSMWQRQN